MIFKIYVCVFLFIIAIELQEIANNTKKEITEKDVDKWIEENGDIDKTFW